MLFCEGWKPSVLVIAKSDFRKSHIQFQQKIDQLIFGNQILQSLNHVDVNLKPRFLIKTGYYFVPSPSTALVKTFLHLLLKSNICICILTTRSSHNGLNSFLMEHKLFSSPMMLRRANFYLGNCGNVIFVVNDQICPFL